MIVDAGYDRLFVVRLSEIEWGWMLKKQTGVDGSPRDTIARLLYAAIEPERKPKKKITMQAEPNEKNPTVKG